MIGNADFSVFSVKPFTFIFYNGQRFHWQAIAVHGLIAWNVGKDDRRAPIFWATQREELQAMIDEKDRRLLELLKEGVEDKD